MNLEGLGIKPIFEPTPGYFMEWLELRNKPIPIGGGQVAPRTVLVDNHLFDVVYSRWLAREKGDVPLDS